jgi:hypothetical protein
MMTAFETGLMRRVWLNRRSIGFSLWPAANPSFDRSGIRRMGCTGHSSLDEHGSAASEVIGAMLNVNGLASIPGGIAMSRCPQGKALVFMVFLAACLAAATADAQRPADSSQLRVPISVYSHLPASAEKTGVAPLNETLALRQLDDLVRLKNAGIRIDYDLVDATWFAPAGSYYTGPTSDWPKGPGAWIGKCRAAGIRSGLRFGGNVATPMQAPPAWKDSLDQDGLSLSLFEGSFLHDFMASMQSWYDHGIRFFELDSVNLAAATPASAAKLTHDEIVARNAEALRQALDTFRKTNRDAVVVIYGTSPVNPGLRDESTVAAVARVEDAAVNPPANPLESFQLLSTGQPMPSTMPQADFQRSIDIESDTRVRRLEQSGVSLQQIDSAGFTVGFSSGLHAFRGAFLLAMARGGWVNTVHGDLHQIQDSELRWMARVQKLFFELQAQGRVHSFGALPGAAKPYGFAASDARGSVYVVINPGQAASSLALPPMPTQPVQGAGRVQFRDAGFLPRLNGNSITLGPGQMAMVGFGAFSEPAYSFGVQEDVVIPNSIESFDADFHFEAPRALEARFEPPMHGVIRVVVRPRSPGGLTLTNSTLRDPSKSYTISDPLTFQATQSGRSIPVRIQNSGASGADIPWLVGEVDVNDLTPGVPIEVRFRSEKVDPADLIGSAYSVEY